MKISKKFLLYFAALFVMGGFFMVNSPMAFSIAPPSATTLFSDDFEASSKWTAFSGSTSPSRSTTSNDDMTVGASGKGFLFEGANGSNPDDGADREIAIKGYKDITIQYSRTASGFETGDSFVAQYSFDGGAFTTLETITADQPHAATSFAISNPDRHTKLTLRFYINADNGDDEAGVDDVLVTGSTAPTFYDGFESGDYSTGGWVIEEAPTINQSDSNMWTDNNTSSDGHSANIDGSVNPDSDDAIIKTVDTTNLENIMIRFSRKVDNLSSGESFKSYYSTDDGVNWTVLEGSENVSSSSVVVFGPLPSSANNNPNFKIRFEMNGNSSGDDAYLDDVVVWGEELTAGSITVTKTTVGGDGTFDFTGDAGTFEITTTAETGNTTINNLEPGSYDITETAKAGWLKTADTCQDVSVVAGETATCTITNTKLTTISGMKFEDSNGNGIREEGETGVENWPIFLARVGQRPNPEAPAGPGNMIPLEMVALELTGSNGTFEFEGNFATGNYKVMEGSQEGWSPTTPPIDSFFDITYQIDWQGIEQASLIDSFFDIFIEVPGQESSGLEFGNFHNITITIQKDVVNPQEGEVDDNHSFNARLDEINGEEITEGTPFTFSENTPQVFENMGMGTYKISEITGDPDFDLLSINNDNDTDPTNGAEFNVATSGQNITVIITNKQKQATLTIQKIVTHPNGGTETAGQFSFSINGGDSTAFTQNESDPLLGENVVLVNPGSYTVTETIPSGNYAISYTDCSGTLASNGSATCVITNSDITAGFGAITVIKNLPNNNGGTFTVENFPLKVTSVPSEGEPNITGMASGLSSFFTPGDYVVSETNPGELTGFTQSISCVSGETVIASGNITLADQQGWVCTITNDDQPGQLTIIKNTGNENHNGTFEFTVTGQAINPNITTTAGTGQTSPISLNKGSYNIVELTQAGWTLASSSCSETITINNGDEVTCTFTNTRQMGTLIVQKVIINDDGRTKTAADFSFQVDTLAAIAFEADGQNEISLIDGTYTITEVAADGYSSTYQNCSAIEITVNNEKTCIITNNDIKEPSLGGAGSNPTPTDTTSVPEPVSPPPGIVAGAETSDLTAGQGGGWLLGDLNHDGKVDAQDAIILIAAWSTTGGEPDLNADGIVNEIDFAILMVNWS